MGKTNVVKIDAGNQESLPDDNAGSKELAGKAPASGIKTIALEGKSSPDLPLAKGELVLLDVAQGWRDLGLMAKLARHKGRLIITNRRAIVFKKKTKDYEIEQLRLSHAGYVNMGHRLQMVKFTAAFGMSLLGVSAMVSGAMTPGAILLVLGLIGMFTARRQGLRILGSGGSLIFDTKSVSHVELAKVLTVINGTA